MIKGLRSRRPRLASKFPYFYHVRLFISTFLTCHSAIIDSCNNLCFPYLSGGTRKNIWNDTFIENNPMATIHFFQFYFVYIILLKLLIVKMFLQLPFTPFQNHRCLLVVYDI